MDYEIGKIGILEREVRENFFLYKVIIVEVLSYVFYYLGVEKIVIKFVYYFEIKEILGV